MKTVLDKVGKKIFVMSLAASLISLICYLFLLHKNFLEADVFGKATMYLLSFSGALNLLTSLSEGKAPKVTIRIPLYKLSNRINSVVTRVLRDSEKISMFSRRIKMLKPTITISKFKFNDEYVILINTDKDLARNIKVLNRIISKYSGEVKDLKSVLILKNNNGQDGLNLVIVREENGQTELFENNIKVKILGKKSFEKMLQNLNMEAVKSQSIIIYGEEFVNKLMNNSACLEEEISSEKQIYA
ncbi:MAG: hypothetical protein QXR97_07150 [Thermoproteota archaeon]